MIEQLDHNWMQGKFLLFKDEGAVSPGSATRKFLVQSRKNGTGLGYVKWFNQWRQYCFFPVNAVFDKTCLREAADFCELVTNQHLGRS